MTKSEIIASLFVSPAFLDCINKMEPYYLREDLKQEVALTLLEKPEEKIVAMHSAGELPFYAWRVITNMIRSSSSPFYKKFRGFMIEFNEEPIQCMSSEDSRVKQGLKAISSTRDEQQQLDEFEKRELWEGFEKDFVDIILNAPPNEDVYFKGTTLGWYEVAILKLYFKYENFRDIETETGIPWASTYKTFKKLKQKLKNKFGS